MKRAVEDSTASFEERSDLQLFLLISTAIGHHFQVSLIKLNQR